MPLARPRGKLLVLRANPEKREEKERIRHALLRATLRLAARHGFASLGLREVSREAAIAPTSFYRHFADMEELGRALISDLLEPALRGTNERVRGQRDPCAALVDAMLELAQADPELVRFAVAEHGGAFVSLRVALRAQLSALSVALQGELGAGVASHAAEAAVVLILDGCERALDAESEARGALREQLLQVLGSLLGEAQGLRRQA